MRFRSLHIKPALKGDSSRARPVGDAARGESGGIGSIASGSAARRPYSNQRCGFRVAKAGGVIKRLIALCLSQPLSLTSFDSSPAGAPFGVLYKHGVQCRTPRGAIVSMGLRGGAGGLRGEIEIFPGPPAKKHYIFPSFSSSQRFFTRKVATWLPWLPRPKPSSAPLARACAEAT